MPENKTQSQLTIQDIVKELLSLKSRLEKIETRLLTLHVPKVTEEGLKNEIAQWISFHWEKYSEPVRNRTLAQRFGRRAQLFDGYQRLMVILEREKRIAIIRNLNDASLYLPFDISKTLSTSLVAKFEEIGLTPHQIEIKKKQRAAIQTARARDYLEEKRSKK
jgi:hypothetical protein